MEKYWEELYNVDFDIQWVNYQEYPQKLNTLLAANAQPDVIQAFKINESYYYPIFTQAIDAGNFLDLTPYVHGENGLAQTNAVMKNWDQSMWDQSTYNGGIYILPRSKSEVHAFSGINVRRDLMRKYGYEQEPTTMDELKDWLIGLSNAATEGEGSKIYALEFWSENFMHDRVKAFAVAFTGQMDWRIDENGEFQYMQFNPKYIDFLNWLRDLYQAGVLDPEFALGNNETSKWKGGKSVAYLTQWYNWNQSADRVTDRIFESSNPDTLEAWCLLPVRGPESIVINTNPYDVDSAIAISSHVTPEQLERILVAFNGTEETHPGYNQIMANGVEGIHYTLTEDGTMTMSEEQRQKRTEGYVGAWNQIFLKKDADQITDKFMRAGARAASAEAVERAREIRAILVEEQAKSGIKHENVNLTSQTYANNWSTLVADVNSSCVQYVMGLMNEDQWKSFVDGIVNSPEYKAIQAEFKAAAAGN